MSEDKKYQKGTELGYNNVDRGYSGSYSTLEGELLDQEGFFTDPREQQDVNKKGE